MASSEHIYTEAEYLRELEAERHLFAWCLVRLGAYDVDSARAAALERYPYEPAANQYRDLIFHETSWTWAMYRLFGDDFHRSHPDLLSPSPDYDAEADAFQRSRGSAG